MTITITKTRLALAIVAFALLIPATAYATHTFSDVPDGEFYTDAVEWAFDNGITTGTTATTFEPDAGVTRGQNVTFAKRYDDNIVQPALTQINSDVDAAEATLVVVQAAVAALAESSPSVTVMHYSGATTDASISFTWEKMRDLGSFTKAAGDSHVLISKTGHGRVDGEFCHWQLRVDGTSDAGNAGGSYAEADGANAVQYATGSYFTQGLFQDLSAGSHSVELWVRGNATACENNDGDFGHDVFAIELAA
jgi:hypothetical protein